MLFGSWPKYRVTPKVRKSLIRKKVALTPCHSNRQANKNRFITLRRTTRPSRSTNASSTEYSVNRGRLAETSARPMGIMSLPFQFTIHPLESFEACQYFIASWVRGKNADNCLFCQRQVAKRMQPTPGRFAENWRSAAWRLVAECLYLLELTVSSVHPFSFTIPACR